MSVERQAALAWMRKAEHDWRTALAALEENPPITDTAAFHVQQAVEKLLKAFLVFHDAEFEHVHDLAILCDGCAHYDPAFAALQSSVAPLTVYAVRFRYPGPADPSLDEVRKAVETLQEVHRLICLRISPDVSNEQ